MGEITHIPVVFDKSHLLTIGGRLYATNLDLIYRLAKTIEDHMLRYVICQVICQRIVSIINSR